MVRRRAILAGSCLAAIAAAGLVAGASAPAGAAPSAADLVRAFNTRPLGSPGFRRVHLALESGAATTRTFQVVHAWREEGAAVLSYAFLEGPGGLAGTSYLLAERESLPAGLEVFLRLRLAGPDVLTIESGRFEQGLLGSDFSYRDLAWRIPVAGRRLELLGTRTFDAATAWIVESRPMTAAVRASTPWDRVEYAFSAEGLLLGADYFGGAGSRGDGAPPAKSLRLSGWRAHGDVWSPARMVMSRPSRRRSVMTLSSLTLRVRALERLPFSSSALAPLGEQFERGAPPPVFMEKASDAP